MDLHSTFFTLSTMNEITRLRVDRPELLEQEYRGRCVRKEFTRNGKLVILAADHPARHITRVGTHATAMGNRLDYLGRILRVMAVSNVDGVMGTNDVLDDLVLANYIYKRKFPEGKGFLDGKLLMGSVNRSGLAGAVHEMYDMPTSYLSAAALRDRRIDAAKVLWRYCGDGDPNDRNAIESLLAIAHLVDECVRENLPIFVEPLPVELSEKGYTVSDDPDALIRIIGVAQALGNSTARTWLKIPYCRDFARVCLSSTLPILLLGGPSTGKPMDTLKNFRAGLEAGANVRGALVGRNLLYCGEEDPAAVAEAIVHIVHENLPAEQAMERARSLAGTKMDLFQL